MQKQRFVRTSCHLWAFLLSAAVTWSQEPIRPREIQRALKTYREKCGRMPACCEYAAILRKATQRALCEHGSLEFRRGASPSYGRYADWPPDARSK